jgi:hypothetical protein
VQVFFVAESQPAAVRMGDSFAKLGMVMVTSTGTESPAGYDTGAQVTLSRGEGA